MRSEKVPVRCRRFQGTYLARGDGKVYPLPTEGDHIHDIMWSRGVSLRARAGGGEEGAMIAVGVRELKARLSSYIEIARGGEEVVVTAHGREVAILGPVTKERMALTRLSEGGEARMSRGKPKGARGVKVKGKPLADTVLESRR
jgi:prevent-host-death family protein